MSDAVVEPDDATPEDPVAQPDGDGMVAVALPSGAIFPVHSEEVDYIIERSARYLSENHFSNVADFQDVDRMLIIELLCFRWGTWISRQRDYWGDQVDVNELQNSLKAHSVELRQLKKSLGIDKVARDRSKGEDSVPAYIANLQRRAKEFGVHREKQLGKALELFNELKALVTLHVNCDEIERRELHMEIEDVLEWLQTIAFPAYDEIDQYFREHQQKAWVRSI